jgi:hypothetical protein
MAFLYSYTNNPIPFLNLCRPQKHYATSQKVAVSCPEEVDFFQFTFSFQPHYVPGVDSAPNRNEHKQSCFGGKRAALRVRLTNLPPSVNRLPRQNVGASTSHNPMGLHGLLQG